MKRNGVGLVLGICLALATTSSAERLQPTVSGGEIVHGGLAGAGRAARDTTYLLGGPGRLDGKFQDAAGIPAWHGWTHLDATDNAAARWHISDFHSPTGTPALWCGQESFPNACGAGYGNNWQEDLVFAQAVDDPQSPIMVQLRCVFNSHCEPGFDYFRIQCRRANGWQNVVTPYDGVHAGVTIDVPITFQPDDYAGPGADEVQLRLQGFSEGAWSDEDCLYDSNGLAQIDDIRVTVGSTLYVDNFDDGVVHHWTEIEETGCGDFTQIWQGLQDIDVCVSNLSPQVAFIDDGVVVPGTGGTPCISWCYGPGGYIVNNTGGLQDEDDDIDNLLVSPPLIWPAGNGGAIFTFDVYRHEDLISGVSPGIFYQWHVRSVDSGDAADLADAPWVDRNFVYYGRNYLSEVQNVSDLIVPGCTHVQVALRCLEYGWVFTYEGYDGTPAPYFDNVAFKVFPYEGPALTARSIDLAQDGFPERGELDLVNLANNWVRFDMARNIAPDNHQRNDPGDSILVDIALPRAGSVLSQMPKLVVKMKANALFDAVRMLPANFTQAGDVVDGWVYGDSTRQPNGTVVPNRYHFDLPDSSFLFPGDVLHYYVEAQDNQGGDVGTATLPADLTGFDEFSPPDAYRGVYTVRALPTVVDATGIQPWVLYWNDGGTNGEVWFEALAQQELGGPAPKFDVYETNGPSAGVGNGLGGRATSDLLDGYSVLLYTCGELSVNTIANNDFNNDPSDDIGVLDDWFQQGDKHAFLTGDDLVYSLTTSGSAAQAFLNQHFSVQFISNNLLPYINNQTSPTVVPTGLNSIFTTPDTWVVSGGCPGINDFDAFVPANPAVRQAEFLTPSGEPGYPYSAAQRCTNVADVVFLPYDFAFVENPPGYQPSHPGFTVRTEILYDLFYEFGVLIPPPPSAVPGAGVLTVSASPNPFNPRTTISLDLPAAGKVSVQLYDLRGRCVRTLQDGPLPAGPTALVWQGDDDAGRALASGVYFYEVKAASENRIGKLALVR